jgi:hypothetical protein
MTSPQETAPAREGWRRHVHGLVAERLGLKATALFVSLLLWFVVHFVLVIGSVP